MNTPSNPPAFPFEHVREYHTTGTPYKRDNYLGMTLRDWFAGQALVALANEHHGNDWGTGGVEHGPICARKAYSIADAMLAERERSNG